MNRSLLAAEAGISDIRRPEQWESIAAAEKLVGVDPYTWFPITISGRLDEKPWTNGICANNHPSKSARVLSRMLHTACYVLVAYLSGMRESEVKSLRPGCVTVLRRSDGTPYRWTVSGTAFKGAKDPHGVDATWTVGAPVARAIDVLTELRRPGTEYLFTFLTQSRDEASGFRPNRVFTTCATNVQLNDLCSWINNYCADHGRTDIVPTVNGAPWILSTRQFRRTLAWFIARQPGGAVAGAIAYRHLSIQMFEGYAGTSDSGFRAEVEAEQALLRGNDLMAMIDQHAHTPVDRSSRSRRRNTTRGAGRPSPVHRGCDHRPQTARTCTERQSRSHLPRRIRNMCLRCPKSAVSEQQRRQERSSAARSLSTARLHERRAHGRQPHETERRGRENRGHPS